MREEARMEERAWRVALGGLLDYGGWGGGGVQGGGGA